jgi:hypothetical protein
MNGDHNIFKDSKSVTKKRWVEGTKAAIDVSFDKASFIQVT